MAVFYYCIVLFVYLLLSFQLSLSFFLFHLLRMPMLDLLIHVTAANKIAPSSHVLQVTDNDGRILSHKPSTPIGIIYSTFYSLEIEIFCYYMCVLEFALRLVWVQASKKWIDDIQTARLYSFQ